MKLVMTLLLRDEEDVLEANLRYHLEQGVDFFIATNNRSTDRTSSILREYARQGVLHVIDEMDDDYAQSRWVTRMARLAARQFDADWVVHADADEFFYAHEGSLRDALGRVPRRFGIVTMPRLNFRPRPEDGSPFHQRLIVRESEARNPIGQPLPPKVCHRARRSIVVGPGNHSVGRTLLKRLDAPPISIFHYPMRSYEQLERKVRVGAAAVARNPKLPIDVCLHWRQLDDLLTEGRLGDYYERQIVDDTALARGLRSGDLVIDRRMASRLAATSPAQPSLRLEATGTSGAPPLHG